MRRKLIDFRKSLGFTISEISAKLNVSASFYEKIERGERNPSFNFMSAFKETFPYTNTDSIFFNDELHEKCK